MAGLLGNQVQGKELEATGLEHALAFVGALSLSIWPIPIATGAAFNTKALTARAVEVAVMVKVVMGVWHVDFFNQLLHQRYIFTSI
ncbi:MAG: hypothetical protein RSD57_04020 [Comamonas sp.]